MPDIVKIETAASTEAVRPSESSTHALVRPGFNVQMACAGMLVLIFSVVGCYFTSVRIVDEGTLALGLGAIAILTLPIALLLHEKKQYYLRDSLLTVVWAFAFTLLLGFPVTVAARLGMHIPLQDLRFEQWDRMLGIHVPDIQAWAYARWVGPFEEKCYLFLFPFMQIGIVLSILTGRLVCAQKFILANLTAFAIGLPIFALMPGVDPWFADHFSAVPDAALCRDFVLLAIRQPGTYLYRYPAGAICFPSFHVIWALLTAYMLWGIRPLRPFVFVIAMLIVISTVTTGNHYVVDVLAGVVVAAVSIAITNRTSRSIVEHQPPSFGIRKDWNRATNAA